MVPFTKNGNRSRKCGAYKLLNYFYLPASQNLVNEKSSCIKSSPQTKLLVKQTDVCVQEPVIHKTQVRTRGSHPS